MKKRSINLDVIRVVATFSVLSVHFFWNNGFYDQIVAGKKMFLATTMRSTFMICVPLFLLLTGYLMNQKNLSKKYLWNIKKVLSVYVLSLLAILLYRFVRYAEAFSLKDIIYNITNYTYYSWYIEMYIGLYLLIPFINLGYNNLKSKDDKRLMCIIFLFTTTVPNFINAIFEFAIVPDWWSNIWPITYYIIGAYISEYKDEMKLSLKLNLCLMIGSFLFAGACSYTYSYNKLFMSTVWNDWGGFTNVLSSVLVFLFLVRLDMTTCPNWISKVITFLSMVSLPTYLLSYVADDICYSVFNSMVSDPLNRVFYYVPVVAVVILLSVCFATVVHYIDGGIKQLVTKVIK